MRTPARLTSRALGVVALLALPVGPAWSQFAVRPSIVRLDRPEGSQQLLVHGPAGDVTRRVAYEVEPPTLARVDADGLVHPLSEGQGQIVIRLGGETAKVALVVTGLLQPAVPSFALEIQPILSKSRCNSGGCHGKAEGQGNFKLSLLGFDDAWDYDAITKEGRARRVRLAAPASSLMLLKGGAIVPHGGGLKLDPASPGFARLKRWIAAGAPRTSGDESPVVRIEIEPAELTMQPRAAQQLRVTAMDAAGNARCVTAEADFLSNASTIIDVSGRGLMQAGQTPGDAAILVRYLGHVSVCRVTVPRAGVAFARPAENNFIDGHAWTKLARLGIPPSDLADDSTFIRRVYLDVLGVLPTAAEARAFLGDASPDKRTKLIDAVLARPEYADYWSMRWANLLRADKLKVTPQGALGLTRWLRRQFADNRPYDAMVREILTIQGPVQGESPAAFFKALDGPEVASRSISQLFLGVRIECAQCHHHPSERWSQDDYAGLAGFFTGVSVKGAPVAATPGAPPAQVVVSRGGTDLKHPRTGIPVPARALGAEPVELSNVGDRRVVLADWMVAPENPFFARAIANRLWAHYFGRGLVEPVDDLRATNPAVNEPLLAALTAHMKEVKYDLRAFTKTLLGSRLYQLTSETNERNGDDRQHFSHAANKVLPAEVLLDSISQVTGVPEKFEGWPLGVRSVEVWDNRMPSYFFRIFGRPVRATVCECERSNEPSVTQALHLLNSPEIEARIRHRDGRARKLAASNLDPAGIVDELYLTALARFPTADERALLIAPFAEPGVDRAEVVEDVLWTILNAKEFLFNH